MNKLKGPVQQGTRTELPLCHLVNAIHLFILSLLPWSGSLQTVWNPDQARQNVEPVPDPYCLTLMVFLK